MLSALSAAQSRSGSGLLKDSAPLLVLSERALSGM